MSAVKLAPTIKLNNGYEMPMLGLGTYKLRGIEGKTAIREALALGYRHIDTAFLHKNEAEIGEVLKEEIQSGRIKREDLFIVTKLWNHHHHPKLVYHAFELSLEALGLDYVDLYLMHYPDAFQYVKDDVLFPYVDRGLWKRTDINYVDTYEAMEELVDEKLVRSLGISNFDEQQTEHLLENCRIKPVTIQVECHPMLNQLPLIEFSRKHDIIITAHSPLMSPKPAQPKPKFYDDPSLMNIAQKYNKTPAQVVLRFLIDIGTVPIPKAKQSQHIKENFDVFDFALTAEELEIMYKFNSNTSLYD